MVVVHMYKYGIVARVLRLRPYHPEHANFLCNQQRVLLLLLHRRNILERAGKTHHHSKKKDMETNTHHHWGKRVTTPMTFDIQNITLFMSHEHVTLKMSYLERRVNEQRVYSPSSKKQCMKPGRCLWRKLLKIRMILFLQYYDKIAPWASFSWTWNHNKSQVSTVTEQQ